MVVERIMCIDTGMPRVIMPRNAAGSDAPEDVDQQQQARGTCTVQDTNTDQDTISLLPLAPHQHPSRTYHHGQRTQQLLQPEEEERL